MRYLPHTDDDISAMLKIIGIESLDELFSTVPEDCRFTGNLNLPESLTEWELSDLMDALSRDIAVSPESKVFMGAGSYEHYIPYSVSYLLSRSEFVTSYTPYQPEVSQGTLQAIYEYQTLITSLLGMDIATASHYDGATALAEALLMANRVTKRKKVAISSLVNPLCRRVIKTYFKPTEYEIVELPYLKNGRTDVDELDRIDDLAAVAVQSPNFFGCIEDLQAIGERAHDRNALLPMGSSKILGAKARILCVVKARASAFPSPSGDRY